MKKPDKLKRYILKKSKNGKSYFKRERKTPSYFDKQRKDNNNNNLLISLCYNITAPDAGFYE